jgi:hypothetical protein
MTSDAAGLPACPICGSVSGEPCKTATGAARTVAHMLRLDAAPVDDLAEVCRTKGSREVRDIMGDIRPEMLSAIEVMGVLAILRVAHSRLMAKQKQPAPVLALVKGTDRSRLT